jgi:tetratricopeptide (TPR) repeat protein
MNGANISVGTLLAIVLSCSLSRGGEPCLWEAAREPRRSLDVAALRAAEAAYLQAGTSNDPRARRLLQHAVRTLDRADAASSPDPRVRFFFGRMLSRVDQDERAVEVLLDAIAFAPHHPSVNEALFALAVSLARLGRSEQEILAYGQWLDREWSREHRAIGLSNLAEAFMAAGRMDEAVRSYRDATAHAHDNALAYWGLAVALDRSGDTVGAIEAARTAMTYDPHAAQIDSPNVFFVPAHDRFWYHAVGSMARAATVQDIALQRAHWQRAALFWQQYLDVAPLDDRWVPIARLRRIHCEQRADALGRSRPR